MSPSPLCKVCQGRLDAVLWSVGRHPNCRPAGPIDDAALARLIDYLADIVGAVVITKKTETTP